MTTANHFRITATIVRARQRLEDLDPKLVTYDQLRVIEERNISRLEDLLAEPMSVDIIEEVFE